MVAPIQFITKLVTFELMKLKKHSIKVKKVFFNSFVALWLYFLAVYWVLKRPIIIVIWRLKMPEESIEWKTTPSELVSIANFLTDKFMNMVL